MFPPCKLRYTGTARGELFTSALAWETKTMFKDPSIFMIGWEYPPHNSGGLGVACDGLTRALFNAGHRIYFTLPYKHNLSLSHLQLIDCHDPAWENNSQAPFSVYSKIINRFALTAEEVARGIESFPQSEIELKVSEYANIIADKSQKYQSSYDLIHAHDWMSFPAAQRVKQKTGKKMIAHIHSTEFDRIPHGSGSSFIKQTEYDGMRSADMIIAVSHYTKRILVDKYGIDENKIEVLHNGVDPLSQASVDLIHFAPNRPLIVFMGRLTMQKGAQYFIQLAEQVLQELPNALFVLAGSGDEYRSLLFKAAGSRLSASVLFTGFLRGKEREILLSRADVFVMPSLSEPFGLVAVEAAQRGIPVIVSKNSGVSEVLSAAIQADFWDMQKMKTEILRLLDSEKYSQAIVSKQNEDLKNITWQKTTDRLRDLYKRVLS